MKSTHIIVRKLTSTLAIGALLGSAVFATAGPLQEFGRDSVYAKGAITRTAVRPVASVERFGRSSLYAGDVAITPWKDPGRLPSTIAGNGRGSVYATPLLGQPQQTTRIAQKSQ